MFIIKWRKKARVSPIITGLRQFPTPQAAEEQIAIWQQLWPNNQYFIEPVSSKNTNCRIETDASEQDWWE